MIVLDTHVLIWAVDDDARLGRTARAAVDEAGRADGIAISAITPWEIALLAEKGRLRLGCDAAVWIDAALDLPGVQVVPIESAIAIDSVRLPGGFHADPADRSSSLLLATAARRSSRPTAPSSTTRPETTSGPSTRVGETPPVWAARDCSPLR